tara:strand:+ start:122 stop:343 length:222 start_codon:yes stop_codon:yes gene_type:complete
MSMTETIYNRNLDDIFKSLPNLNRDKGIELNNINSKIAPILNGIHSTVHESISDDPFHIMIIPKETLVSAYEM